MKNILRQLARILPSGGNYVLATVVRTSGSTPQKPGNSALFGEEGLLAGTVGGGLLEAEVEEIARHVMISRVSDLYYFDLDSEQGEDGAICGGAAEVLIDSNPETLSPLLKRITEQLSQGKSGYLVTRVTRDPDQGRKIERSWVETGKKVPEGETLFTEEIHPLPRLLITGAGHVGRALAHLGNLLDFEVTVADDREQFANPQNIPDADHCIVGDMADAVRRLGNRPDSYVVIVTRGHKQDENVLRACLELENPAYLGMIGSKHKVKVMKEKFLEEGWASEQEWKRIHAPIGLPIGSKSVEEIAVSIAAELVQVRSRKKPRHES